MSLDNVETSLEPVDMSDLTIHFKDHAYHAHTQILSSASAYFAAAVKAARSDGASTCELTEKCREAGHHCITLPDSPAGQDVDVSEMSKFLSLLYDPGLLVNCCKRSMIVQQGNIEFGYQPATNNCKFKFVVSNAYVKVRCTVHFGCSSESVSELNFDKARASGDEAVTQFVQLWKPAVQLSSYFDCRRWSTTLENMASVLVDDAILMNHFDGIWQLLVVADHNHWKLVTRLVDILGKDGNPKNRPGFKEAMEEFKSGRCNVKTLAALYEHCQIMT